MKLSGRNGRTGDMSCTRIGGTIMAELKYPQCKVIWCFAKKPAQEYELRPIKGDCLEEAGVPNRGHMLVNRTIKPKVGDLVWCNTAYCSVNGFIKQVKAFDGDTMIVQTRYKDKSKDYEFYVCECYGVVEMVFDIVGNLCYRRVPDVPGDLRDLIADVNPTEIASHIEEDNLRSWCHAWREAASYCLPTANAVELPAGKPGDYVKWKNGVSEKLYEINSIMTCKEGMRYDLGDLCPFVNHPAILEIMSQEEAERWMNDEDD
jgi:hypothetical protein